MLEINGPPVSLESKNLFHDIAVLYQRKPDEHFEPSSPLRKGRELLFYLALTLSSERYGICVID